MISVLRRPTTPIHPLLLAEALTVSVAVRISLRLRGVGATTRLAGRVVGASCVRAALTDARDPRELPNPRRIEVLFDDIPIAVRRIGSRRPFRFACQPRSLTVWILLRRRRVPVDLRIGVSGGTSDFASHAWVEWRGLPVGEGTFDVTRFRALPLEHWVIGAP